jgi:dTDP-4-amino-4,6-dideoxygalactose transaminase
VVPGSARARGKFLPYALPSIGEEEIAEVIDCLRSGWITTGPKVKRFEAEFSRWIAAKEAIAVNSCTAGLHIALAAAGVEPGDEVILPSLTFCATANVVVHLGATPILVESKPDFNIDPDAVAAAITPRTKAVIPVHYAGQSCDLDAIYQLARTHNLAVIEDAAHAVGSTYFQKKIGSDAIGRDLFFPHAAVFSFYATKNMTTGEGGMITSNHTEMAERMRLLALHGMSRDAWKRYSATGSWFYDVVDAIATRQRYAQLYTDAFRDLDGIQLPEISEHRNHTCHLYVIRLVPERLTIGRDEFIQEMTKANIGVSVHFIPVHLHTFYRSRFGYVRGQLPRTEDIYDRIVSLPLYPAMTEDDVRDVIDAVRRILSKYRKATL